MKQKTKKKTGSKPIGFTTTNYAIFGLAILIIVIGYFFLAQGPARSFSSLTIAPILLVIGYVLLIPIAIFWRPKARNEE